MPVSVLQLLLLSTISLSVLESPSQKLRTDHDSALRALAEDEEKVIQIPSGPRIVTLDGRITETVIALGRADDIVGLDSTSVYPPRIVKDKTEVGYVRMLSAEGVLSLLPEVIIASGSAGPPQAVEQIKKSGVRWINLDFEDTPAGTRKLIQKLGSLFQKKPEAAQLITSLDNDLQSAFEISRSFEKKPRILFIYARGSRVLNVAGKKTSAHEIIQLTGAINAFDEIEGYRPLTAESVIAAAPDIILMMEKGKKSLGGSPGILRLPGIPLTPAGKMNRIISMPDMKLLGFGPRLGEAVLDLTKSIQKVTSSKNKMPTAPPPIRRR